MRPKKLMTKRFVCLFSITLVIGLCISVESRSSGQPIFGTLLPFTSTSSLPAGPPRVVVNGDGFPDAAVTGRSDFASVQILLGDGRGNFRESSASPFPAGRFPNQIAAADFNRDGKDDLALSNAVLAGEVRVLLSNGDGSFHNAPGSPLTMPANAVSLGVADFNGDGKADLVVGHADISFASILLGDGAGGFTQGTRPSVASGGEVAVSVGDFNQDGKPDFAAVDLVSGAVTIQLGQGNGTFNRATGSPFSAGAFATDVVSADFNRDGKQDLAVGLADNGQIAILLGKGDGSFAEGARVPIGSSTTVQFVAAGEFNGDNKTDLVVVNVSDDDEYISLLLGDGTGGFAPPTKISVGNGSRPSPSWLVVADFNRDGNADVATANIDKTISVLLGNGAGAFGVPLRFGVAGGATWIAAADLNLDGKLDLAVNHRDQGIAGNFAVFLGNGDGTFGGQLDFPNGDFPAFLGVADFNHDGKPDVVTANRRANTVSVWLNNCVPITADLRLEKTAFPEQLLAGSNMTWTINVKNQGPGEARSIIVNDTLSSGTSFVACEATEGGVCGGTGNNRTIAFAALAPGTEATIKLTARIGCEVPDDTWITNTATVNAATPDPELQNNSAHARSLIVNPPPQLTHVSVDKPVLWPHNHKLVNVRVNYDVTDRCGAGEAVTCQLSVTSNESVDPRQPDWVIVDAHHVKLRAERDGKGNGRVYTITITCRDRAGGVDSATTTVKVPKSPGK